MSLAEERRAAGERMFEATELPEDYEVSPTIETWVDDNLWVTDHSYGWVLNELGISGTQGLHVVLGMALAAFFAVSMLIRYRRWQKRQQSEAQKRDTQPAKPSKTAAHSHRLEGHDPYQID
ncbi:hypothetical protein [Vreelandella massiliensis]|uniref:hypothetical protein n=1 Tax=Vreelandella massiliensis TaxID=1816686 RepID=UPI00096A2310|nr:hypothetical protein [Halomonas massiliensis]